MPLLLLILAASPAQEWKVDAAWIVAGQGADLAYTEYALSHGAVEANPLLKEQAVRLAVKAAATAGAIALCHHYRKKGEHKKAKIVRWVFFGAGVVALSVSVYATRDLDKR